MDLNADAAASGSEASPIAIAPAPSGERPLGTREAARGLASWRHNRDKRDQAGEPRPTHALTGARTTSPEPVQNSSAPGGISEDAGEHPGLDPGEAPPSETESADREGDLSAEALANTEPPSIEPPRSWTKEDKELFTSLPRATQERIAERERSREGDFSRRQQQATEQAKALEIERQQAEQTRQQYEAALPMLLVQLQQQQAGEFADISTVDDLQRLATDDPVRFGRWQVHQMRVSAVAQQVQDAQQRLDGEHRQRFAAFAEREDELLTERIPSLANKDKAARLQSTALAMLKEIGFTEKELSDSYNGRLNLPIRDHRLQLIVHDAMLWREAQAKAKAAGAAGVPPVQRPGVSQPRGAVLDAQVQNLTKRLETSGSLKDAAALLRARRAAAR